MQEIVKQSLDRVLSYCMENDFRGYDPFDGLSSSLYRFLPFHNTKMVRLMWLQLVKRIPLNIRAFIGVQKRDNPKALALSLSALLKLKRAQYDIPDGVITRLIRRIHDLECAGYHGACWGYPFNWQSRAFFVPKHTPNIIVSTFVGHALLDAWEFLNVQHYFEKAESIARFIMNDLCQTHDDQGNICLSYTPLDQSRIYNASLLGGRFLARLYAHTRNDEYRALACATMKYSARKQRDDGAWMYGEADNQAWADSFHTGYNLEAYHDYQRFTGDKQFQNTFDRGMQYYVTHFFTEDGVPKYYDTKTYPVEVHATAQLVVVMVKTGLLNQYKDLVDKVLLWTLRNMQDKNGGFYYRRCPLWTNKIVYMRWACVWMLVALSMYVAVRGTDD